MKWKIFVRADLLVGKAGSESVQRDQNSVTTWGSAESQLTQAEFERSCQTLNHSVSFSDQLFCSQIVKRNVPTLFRI